jgi:hypothetical protein
MPVQSIEQETHFAPAKSPVPTWATPSLADICACAVFLWMLVYAFSPGPVGPLYDASTGFQIRVGQWIAEHRAVPHNDVFSFTRPGQPYFAWEWLSNLGLFAAYSLAGLKGVLLIACGIIAATLWLLLRRMAATGANALIIVAVLHLVVGASSIHYLARPHIITLFFFALTIGRPVNWWLVPLTALWANLHGGFAAFVVSLLILAVGYCLERNFAKGRRTALVATACGFASLLNPYGWREHAHIIEYMRAKWVTDFVLEFQPPRLGTLEGHYFEILMVLGLAAATRLCYKRRFAEALLIIAWVHAGLTSVRHIPILAICAAPAIAELLMDVWSSIPLRRGSSWAVMNDIARDHAPGFLRTSVAFPVLLLIVCVAPLPWPTDFPAARYPVDVATRQANLLAGARVFTTDSWGDHLVFRNYPRQRVFIDGRCDFYGEKITSDYNRALAAQPGWQQLFEQAGVNAVLVSPDTPLSAALAASPSWQHVESTPQADLFTLTSPERHRN